MIALLLALAGLPALAADPAGVLHITARPERSAAKHGDCTTIAPAPAGAKRSCAAMSVPPAEYAYLLSVDVWADRAELQIAALEQVAAIQADVYVEQLLWREQRISSLEQQLSIPAPTVPFFKRPGVAFGAGVLGGVAAVVLGGWSVGQISASM